MNSVEKVKAELKKQKIPVSKMERELGFANGYIGQLKKGSIPLGRLQQIAGYLGKSLSDLLPDDAAVSAGSLAAEEQRQAAEEGRDDYQREADELIESLQILRDHPETRALLHATRGLTPGQVRQMTEFLKGLKGQSEDNN